MTEIVPVTEDRLPLAGHVHAASWRASHRDVCSPAFVAAHTAQRQTAYLRSEMAAGKQLWLLMDPEPSGVVSVAGDLVENLYVLPGRWGRGYGTLLLEHALRQCRGTPRLTALSSNERALGWYLRRGFREAGRRPLRGGLEEIDMILKEEDNHHA